MAWVGGVDPYVGPLEIVGGVDPGLANVGVAKIAVDANGPHPLVLAAETFRSKPGVQTPSGSMPRDVKRAAVEAQMVDTAARCVEVAGRVVEFMDDCDVIIIEGYHDQHRGPNTRGWTTAMMIGSLLSAFNGRRIIYRAPARVTAKTGSVADLAGILQTGLYPGWAKKMSVHAAEAAAHAISGYSLIANEIAVRASELRRARGA